LKTILTIIITFSVINLFSQEYITDTSKELPIFPCNIGNKWIYQRLNEFTNKTDTISVLILKDTTIDNKPFKVWEYDFNTYKERFYYSDRQDTVIELDKNYFVVQKFILPMKIGTNYLVYNYEPHLNPQPYRESYNKILDKHEVMIGHTIFTCYLILHRRIGYNDYLTEKIWFDYKTGIVKIEKHCWSIGCSMNETWKLIGYNFK